MIKTTTQVAMASPCPYQTKKRPMSRAQSPAHQNQLKDIFKTVSLCAFAKNSASAHPQNKNYLLLKKIKFTNCIFAILTWGYAQSSASAQPQDKRQLPLTNKTRFSILSLSLLIWVLAINPAVAQNKASTNQATNQTNYLLKGKVTAPNGSPLPGASVTESGTQHSAQSSSDGSFQLKTKNQKGRLTVSYLGYLAKETDFDTSEQLTIALSEDPATLKAVEINTGYYSVAQKQLTGSISSIKAEQIEKQPVTNLLSALQGRTPGTYIQQTSSTPGGNISLLIRGRNGIDASSAPLYLIDGIPFPSQTLSNSLSVAGNVFTTGGSSPLNTLSPDDIASIDILKDADATAIYGSRGANGVVLITTKKGRRGSTSADFSAQFGGSRPTRTMEMLQTADYLALRKQAIALDGATTGTTDYDLNGKWDQNAYTNWQEALIGNPATFASYRASLQGGGESSSYLFSASRNDQGSIYGKDLGYSRNSAHLSAGHTSTDQKLRASASILYSQDKTNWANSDLTFRSLNLSPNAPELKNPDGSLNWASSTWINPLRALENGYRAKNATFNASTTVAYSPIKDLELKAILGYNSVQLNDRSYTPVSAFDPAEGRTSATSTSDYGTSSQKGWSSEAQGSYTRSIGQGRLSLLLGATLQQQDREALYLRGTGFVSDALIANISSASTTQVRGTSSSTYRYGGIYGRVNYALKERYILNLTARRDGSSRFGEGRKLASFAAIGAGYLFSEKNLIKEILPQLSLGKLRISYGSSGNDQIGDYEYLDTYGSSTGYNGVAGLFPIRLSNPDFGWEKTRKLEIGLDLGLFKDRISATIGYYRNQSSSQLIDYPLSTVTGFSSVRANLDAKVRNTGWEFSISSQNLQRGKLRWSSSFNLTIPKNTLVDFPGLASSSYASTYVIGRPLSVAKTYQLLGVDPQSGIYVFTDFNGDGVINALDRQVAIDRGQRYYGGLDNTISYRGIELSFLFQFVSQISGNFKSQYAVLPGLMANQPQAYQGSYWQQPGDIAELQRPSSGLNAAANTAFNNYILSDAALSDASFVRLKNVSLSYRTSRLIPGKTIKAYINGQNLWTVTEYFGLDPESANSTLPPLKTFTIGLSLGL